MFAAVVAVFVLVEVVAVVVAAEWQVVELVVPLTATGEPPKIEHDRF